MIDAVLLFGAMNVLFEFVLLCLMNPRSRLRLLGNHSAKVAMHLIFFGFNLVIHWGTVVGTMSAVMAFICSLATIKVAEKVFGFITEGRYYHVGWIKYSLEELQ